MNGGQIVAESNDSRTIVYIYDVSGAPIGMMYRTTSYSNGGASTGAQYLVKATSGIISHK